MNDSEPSLKIVVDCREHDVIQSLSTAISQYPHFQMETKKLDLGDFEIYYQEEFICVIERKTFTDLIHSIKDGRYKEQCYRLLHHYKPNQIMYWIEGIFSQLNPKEKQWVVSSLTTLSFMKGVHIWRTTQVQDTVTQLLLCCDKLYREYGTGQKIYSSNSNNNSNTDENTGKEEIYSNFVVKKEKKENITRENIGIIFLKQIPHISNASALALMNHVNGDFEKLIQLVREDCDSLAKLMVGKRRIGKNIIVQLKNYL